MSDPAPTTESVLRMTPTEHALVIAALRLLRSILGKDEAEELHAVERLLERLGPSSPAH